MPKKATKSEKLGRDEVISDKNLSERYDSLKQFLENNWGRIGLKLQRVRKPSDVSSTFKLIPQVEWCSPFRDYRATCLLDDGSGPVGIRELRVLQRITEDAAEVEDKLWSEYHAASQQAQTARTNLNTLIGEFRANAGLFPFFYVVFVIAKELRVQELNNKFAAVEALLHKAQEHHRGLKTQKRIKEAWFAQNEIVNFRVSKRYVLNPVNLAKATAGLPEYGWLNSFRRCEKLKSELPSFTAYPYQLFEVVKRIVRRMKPLNLKKVEMRLRRELLSEHVDPLLREWLRPHWAYMKRAFAEHRGKRFKRTDLPYLIISRFLHHMERSKSPLEVELAKREESDLSVGS